VLMYIQTYTHTLHTCIHTHTHVHTYIHTYKNIHTHKHTSAYRIEQKQSPPGPVRSECACAGTSASARYIPSFHIHTPTSIRTCAYTVSHLCMCINLNVSEPNVRPKTFCTVKLRVCASVLAYISMHTCMETCIPS
jgi:hypothetical protein